MTYIPMLFDSANGRSDEALVPVQGQPACAAFTVLQCKLAAATCSTAGHAQQPPAQDARRFEDLSEGSASGCRGQQPRVHWYCPGSLFPHIYATHNQADPNTVVGAALRELSRHAVLDLLPVAVRCALALRGMLSAVAYIPSEQLN